MSEDYQAFVHRKFKAHTPTGIASDFVLPEAMFGHQSALTSWALKRGRSAIFADTGLGKMLMELAFANTVNQYTQRPVMIHTPLAVAAQLAAEGRRFGIDATVVRDAADITPGINIANYERLHKFDTSIFGGIVLDESGCIKHHDAKTFRLLTDAYLHTPFKLAATATPAPNDYAELGTHAEFLGICSRVEMLAEFFMHDGGDTSVWRLKGHARGIFWKWVASWGALIRKPSDLGFDDGAYNLPPLRLHDRVVKIEGPIEGMLFAEEAQTLSERRAARRESLIERVAACVETIISTWNADELEARVRAEQEGARGSESFTARETYRLSNQESAEGPGGAEGLHAGVLQGESGEVPEAHTGAMRCLQRETTSAIRGGRGFPGEDQGPSEVVAEKPWQEARSALENVRDDAAGLRLNDDAAVQRLRDLRLLGTDPEDLSGYRPLSSDWQGSRAVVPELQSGARQIQGRPGTVEGGDRVSRRRPWVIWVELNAEQDALEKAFGPNAFSVRGSQSTEEKEDHLARWLAGERPVMISKTSMLGYGINMQMCSNVAFLGVTDSFESYYQAVRRCWRFGQSRPVDVHLFSSSQEGAVAANLKRKEAAANEMGEALSAETAGAVFAEVIGEATQETNAYDAIKRVAVPSFLTSMGTS